MEPIQSRRNLIRFVPAGLFFLWAAGRNAIVRADAFPDGQNPPPVGSPPQNNPRGLPNPFGPNGQLTDKSGPLGPVGKPGGTPNTPRKDLKADEKDIRKQVVLLAQYADELKKEVEKTDSTKVLSLQMLRKTQDIEKLAHNIAKLAAG
jgi:hypothetical protein